MKSKKAVGAAFIAIIGMFITMFFFYQAREGAVQFVAYVGDEQAEFLSALPSGEHAKTYLQTAAIQSVRKALREKAIREKKPADADTCKKFTDTDCGSIKSESELAFISYASIYDPPYGADLQMPDYQITTVCSAGEVKITGYSYSSACEDITPFPRRACAEITKADECAKAKSYDPSNDRILSSGCFWSNTEGDCIINDKYVEYGPDSLFEGDYEKNILNVNKECASATYYDTCTKVGEYTFQLSEAQTAIIKQCAWRGCTDNTASPTLPTGESCSQKSTQPECSAVSGCAWKEEFPDYILSTSRPSLDYQFNLYADGHFEANTNCQELFG